MKENINIYAQTDIFTLLRNGKPALIGSYNEWCKRYKKDGTCIGINCVTFDFENDGNQDKFMFENNELVYYFISVERKSWLADLVGDSVKLANLTPDMLILSVVEKYTLIKMGFMNAQ